jgi:tRNA(fMet)-specific endonuclease VapC
LIQYLLDTNVLSEAIKTTPNPRVMEKLERHQHEIATASIVWHELQFGCMRLSVSRKRAVIQTYLDEVVSQGLAILPYDASAAEWHAEQRAPLAAAGTPPSFVDGQIAAIAVVNRLTLVTRNIDDFKWFSDVKAQNWHQ